MTYLLDEGLGQFHDRNLSFRSYVVDFSWCAIVSDDIKCSCHISHINEVPDGLAFAMDEAGW